ncbi:hypothetical protein [Bacillus atrophaeus]|uniref:hypothetical protein n=1 Tax=Bacillus atrophaeus TaxID=1452 RepID=UPI002281201E|nr:hypothetical protein [Bacillus atrophaeus]MCY8520841.1 hypothetical protein [Bacillus atrophaeus]MCY8527092.1 hypothetical protein [Bacillus atrophaeus]
MKQLGLIVSLLIAVLVISASENHTQEPKKQVQTPSEKHLIKPLGHKKQREFDEYDSEMQLAIIFSSVMQVTEKFDYGIGNPEYFVRRTMTKEESESAKKSLETVKLEKDELNKQNKEAVALLEKSRLSEKSRKENEKLIQKREDFFDITDQMIALINNVTPKNARKTRKQLDQLKKQYTQNSIDTRNLMDKIADKQGVDDTSFRKHLDHLLRTNGGRQTMLTDIY